jgi:hypothetical protein
MKILSDFHYIRSIHSSDPEKMDAKNFENKKNNWITVLIRQEIKPKGCPGAKNNTLHAVLGHPKFESEQ